MIIDYFVKCEYVKYARKSNFYLPMGNYSVMMLLPMDQTYLGMTDNNMYKLFSLTA